MKKIEKFYKNKKVKLRKKKKNSMRRKLGEIEKCRAPERREGARYAMAPERREGVCCEREENSEKIEDGEHWSGWRNVLSYV